MFRLIVIILLAFWGLFLFRSCQQAEMPLNPSSQESVNSSEEGKKEEWKEVEKETAPKSDTEKVDSKIVSEVETSENMVDRKPVKPATASQNYVSMPQKTASASMPQKTSTASLARDSYVKVYLYDNRIDTFGDGVLTGRINLEVINMSRFAQTLSVEGVKDLGRVKGEESTYVGFEALEAGDYTLMMKNIRGEFQQVISVVSE